MILLGTRSDGKGLHRRDGPPALPHPRRRAGWDSETAPPIRSAGEKSRVSARHGTNERACGRGHSSFLASPPTLSNRCGGNGGHGPSRPILGPCRLGHAKEGTEGQKARGQEDGGQGGELDGAVAMGIESDRIDGPNAAPRHDRNWLTAARYPPSTSPPCFPHPYLHGRACLSSSQEARPKRDISPSR